MPILAALLVLAILAWAALHALVLRPKLHAYRVTTGVYDRLGAAEAAFWRRLAIRLEGAKVGIVALATSMVPILGPIYAEVSGVDWTKYLPDGQARTMGLIVLVAGLVGPMIFNALHAQELAKAAAATPVPLMATASPRPSASPSTPGDTGGAPPAPIADGDTVVSASSA